MSLLDRYPLVRQQMRAAVLVAERRWNIVLKNGIDVRLPETGVEQALTMLVSLDRDDKLLSRDITAVDLRLPDRVTVRLSDDAAAAREEALSKEKKARKKGGSA
jgi:cell division protein FtsQ